MSLLDKIPVVGNIRRRLRLEHAPRAVVKGPAGEPALYRYKDPQTGVVYVGKHRWDPFLNPIAINHIDGLTVETEDTE